MSTRGYTFRTVLVIVLAAIALVPAGSVFGSPSALLACTTPVFVNEFHYDNFSTDTGEFIEVAGPAGTDLTGWSIELYSGFNGASYDTIDLSGTIPNEGGSGFGALSFSYAPIQNGAPDGFALVNASTAVQQFLSYEGTFVAVGGPADGMTSTDVGVSETSSTPVGDSLQLTGTGECPEDFTWSGPSDDSPGSINTGQNLAPTAITLSSLTAHPIAPQATFFHWQWLALVVGLVLGGGAVVRWSRRR